MADQFGLFWNSINADRTYDADSFAEWLRKFFTTGVFNGEMQVVPDSGMVVNVQPGYININGKVKFFDSVQAFTIEPASGVYPRIDTIVVRCDSTNRIITTEYVKGDYSGNAPVPTAPVRTGGIYEVVLAQIQVNAGATQILVNNITDTRADDDLCGWVTSTVEGVPMDQIVSQMQAQFLTWFDHMKDQLDEDAAGHLQQEIDQISAAVTSIGNAVQVHTSDFAINEGEGTAASRAYSVGEFLMWYNGLRKVTAPIAQGDPITDQNTADTKVGDELTSLKNGLTNVETGINELHTSGYVPVMTTFSQSGTAVDYTIPSTGLYAVRASTGSTAGTLSVYMFNNAGNPIATVINVNAPAWATIFTPPIPLIAGTIIKAQFHGPNGSGGAIVKYAV